MAHDTINRIESDEGAVLAVSIEIRKVEFILAYCRTAYADRWGVYCERPFRRASDPVGSRSWAESIHDEIFIFRRVRFVLVQEEEWMLRSR